MIKLRHATTEDAPIVARLHIQGWRDGYAGLLPGTYLAGLDIASRTDLWRQRLTQGANIWMAEIDDVPAAMGAYGAPINCVPEGLVNAGEIYLLYALKEFYRLGAGGMLFDHARQALRLKGFSDVFLWVLKDNQRGRAFYNAKGGVECAAEGLFTTIDGLTYPEIAVIFRYFPVA